MAEVEFRNDEKRIHEAMVKAKGSYRKAARTLGIAPTSIKSYIFNSPTLKAIWVDGDKSKIPIGTPKNDVDETGTMFGRDQIIPDDADMKIALAMNQEEIEFGRRLEDLKIKPERVQWMLNVTKLHAQHSAMSIDLINGSLTMVVERLVDRIEKLAETLDTANPTDEATTELYKIRMDAFIRLTNSLTDISKNAMDNVLTKAKVTEAMAKIKKMHSDPANMRSAKPGFTPLQKPVTAKNGHETSGNGAPVDLEGGDQDEGGEEEVEAPAAIQV